MSSVSGILNKKKYKKKKERKKERKKKKKKEEGRRKQEKNLVVKGTLCFPKPQKSGMGGTIFLIFI